ncbi:MAG: hypothetical protein OXC54_10205 [Rhodospirillaceae bacterium]|nr:hypothetical protein [Rhodospirillaceae bacterium]MCY4311662.1 hypothetical protein [Rhodospirillaceae bacterium]
MPIRKTVNDPVTNKEQTGTVVDIVSANEPMMALKLADGTELRIKNSIMEVLLLDEKDRNGEPIYNFSAQMNVQVYPPEKTKNGA